MELFGVKLIGVNSQVGTKSIFTVVVLVSLALLRLVVRLLTQHLFEGRGQSRARFWTRQSTNILTTLLGLVALLSIWFDNPQNLGIAIGLVTAGLAFALQKVVLALAGYFVMLRGSIFRVGDRITMGGVRGDVIALDFLFTTVMEMGDPAPAQGDASASWVAARQYTGRRNFAVLAGGVIAAKCGASDVAAQPNTATSGYLYVSSWGSNEAPFYAPGAKKPTATISKGIADPSALALDSQYNLYVANNQTDTVTVYAPKSTVVLRTIKTGVHGREALGFDGKGNLYVANQTASSITVYAKGQGAPSRTITDGIAGPSQLAIAANRTLYVLNGNSGSVTVYAADESQPKLTISKGISGPDSHFGRCAVLLAGCSRIAGSSPPPVDLPDSPALGITRSFVSRVLYGASYGGGASGGGAIFKQVRSERRFLQRYLARRWVLWGRLGLHRRCCV